MQRGYVLLLVFALLANCNKRGNSTGQGDDDLSGKYVINTATTDTVLFAASGDGVSIPIVVSIPNSDNNLPGMVVMHGSGGNWKDFDTNDDGIDDEIEEWTLSSQNRAWKDVFNSEGIISAFPGSYYPRGTVENEGDWKNPPLQFQISASFIRNQDAFTALNVLRNLVREDRTPIMNSENAGILGFSHGGTAVQSSLFDLDVIPESWEWSQSYSGMVYTNEVLAPVPYPEEGGFKFGIMYYPGSFHNSYYGNPCNGTSIFQTKVDFMLHLASEDPLTGNSNCMVQTVTSNGGGNVTVYTYEGAAHSFDNKDTGIDGTSSVTARSRSIQFIKDKLGLN